MSVNKYTHSKAWCLLHRKSLDPTTHAPSTRNKVNTSGILYIKKQKPAKMLKKIPHFSSAFILPRSFVQFLSQIQLK